MAEPVRLLCLEDNLNDVELLSYELKSSGLACVIAHVATKQEFRAALQGNAHFDLIISDYTLPAFDGKQALAMARELRPDTPFIFVSGTIGEEAAIESLVGGATDYVLKHRFGRLAPAVRRALKETEEKNARREAERELQRALEQLKNLFDNLDEVFFSVDPRVNTLLQISPACERLYGLPQQAFSENPNFWKQAATTDDLPAVQALQSKLDLGMTASCEYRITRADGSIRWVLARMKPVRDGGGQVIRIDGIISDITERKDLEAQFLRAQRLENLGSLAGGIAHDLNNVLAPIMMGVELLRERTDDAATQSTLATVEQCTKRGANLVKQILMFARGVEERRTGLLPARLITDLYTILRRTIPKSIEIVLDLPKDLWVIFADKTQIEQVLMNLCVNARDAMPDGGTLTIQARNELLDPRNSGSGDVEKQPYVVVEVSDTGHGIPAEYLGKIFDPFFTTKAAGSGTGLGLSTVGAIVKSHGGVITISSTVGRGTTFRVALPGLNAEIPKEDEVKGAALPIGGGEVVLVVDDEVAVRDFACTLLENYGYRVLMAADGAEGLSIYSQHKDSIDVVLTDFDMPKMNGVQMVQALYEIKPDLRVIMAGGFIENDKPPGRTVLQKPFSPAQLLKALRGVLQSKNSGTVP